MTVHCPHNIQPGPQNTCWLLVGCIHDDKLLVSNSLALDKTAFPHVTSVRIKQLPQPGEPLRMVAALMPHRAIGADVIEVFTLLPEELRLRRAQAKPAKVKAEDPQQKDPQQKVAHLMDVSAKPGLQTTYAGAQGTTVTPVNHAIQGAPKRPNTQGVAQDKAEEATASIGKAASASDSLPGSSATRALSTARQQVAHQKQCAAPDFSVQVSAEVRTTALCQK